MKWICQFETADGIIGQEFYSFINFPDSTIKKVASMEPLKVRVYKLKNFQKSKLQASYKEKL